MYRFNIQRLHYFFFTYMLLSTRNFPHPAAGVNMIFERSVSI